MLAENWATLWEALAAAQPDHTAVVIGDERLSWSMLDDRAARVAAVLHESGIGYDHKVGQLLYNCPEYLESAYGSFKIRASTVNVNYRYKAREIIHVLADSGATVLVFHSSFAPVVDEVRTALPSLRLLIQVDDGSGNGRVAGAIDYHDAVSKISPMLPVERSGDDTLLLYTGGTTGLPKGVCWSHAGLFGALAYTGYASLGMAVPENVADVARIAVTMQQSGSGPVNMTAPPLMHGTAMFLAFSTFVLGGTVVLLGGRRFDASELLGLVQREKVTQLSIVGDAFARPIVAELDRARADGQSFDVSSLARIVSTGATLSSEMKRALMDHASNAAILDMIGASEGGPFAVAMTMPGQDPLATAQFKATPNTVLLDDGTGEKIAFGSGRSGVLAASGPMPEGYFGDSAMTARTFRIVDGIRYSVPGDHAMVDDDGTVHLLGRGSVCINSGGEKVFPEEVEVAARTHPLIIDCVAVGARDERLGERVALVVATSAPLTTQDVIDHIKSRIADYKAPKTVVFVDEVYRSPSGKADYGWARHLVADRET